MKSWAREFALGLLLATAIPPAAALAAPSATQILLDKANYWRLKDRPDLAISALQQLLSINPNEPDALYQYGMIEVQRGKVNDAKGYLARLQKAAPGNPHIAELENAIRAGQVSPSQLSEARRLAQSGQFAQAAKQYEQTFRGGPPPATFGVEYYMTLAGTPQGWPQARSGLEKLVQNSPNDSKAKVALAEVLTYHADTRPQGIRSLERLANDPVVGPQAVRAWKQALTWLGGSAQDRAVYAQYLAKFPNDAEVRQHMAEAEKQGAPGVAAPGYADLNRGNLAAAERQFAADLRSNPNNPDALAGLGVVRLRQHRLEQARELLGHAIREYRSELAANPGNSAAQSGLRGALSAERAARTAGSAGAARPGPAAPVNTARTRADALRAEGQALESRGDAAAAAAKYQEAIAVDPNDAWARLDYARFLARSGDATQGFQVVDPSASGGTAESFQAAAIFYNEQNRPRDALALLDRIPQRARSASIVEFRDSILLTEELTRAKELAASGNRGAARNVLMSLYSRPPTSAAKARKIADALADIGYPQEALQLARPSAAAAGHDPKAALDYAGLLFRAGRDAEAVAFLAQAERSGRITAAERHQLEHVKIDIAAKRADQLRTAGDIAGAYDQISPLLSAYPNDPTLLLAAGRIYAAAGENEIAMRFFDAAYRQAPSDINVIRGVVGGAIVAGDLDRAQAYLVAGMRLHPNNARLYYLAAQIARADGDNGAAVYDLATAQRLDRGESAAVGPNAVMAPITAPGLSPGLPPNPFRRSENEAARLPVMLAAATNAVSATDATAPAPAVTPAVAVDDGPPAPAVPAGLAEPAASADSADLVVPPRAAERPARRPRLAAVPKPGKPRSLTAEQLAMLGDGDIGSGGGAPANPPAAGPAPTQVAELEPLPPPPIAGYQSVAAAPAGAEALQPLPPPPIAGYQPPLTSGFAPVPRNSLELDIERSMAAISAESGPILQGGFAFRARSGEDGLSSLTDISIPIEGIFSPFYTGTARLQAIPEHLDAGTPAVTSLLRFGREAQLALNPGFSAASLTQPGDQTANGVSLNAGYAYRLFAGEIGTTPLGFPVENIVGRIALMWPGPATLTTAYPTVPPPPTGANPRPIQVKVEGIRQPVTDSLLSFAGTRDPISGQIWGGVMKTGGDALVSYDDGFFGMYGGGGASSLEGKSVASNSELEGLIGAYVRPYRTANTAFKVGLNLSYMGFDKNLRYFTFGQGGYFSPQNYVNIAVPVEYDGKQGRLSWLAGAALGVQSFHETRSPYFPTDPGLQSALQGAFGNQAVYPGRNVTGPSFFVNGQIEYQLDNGFSIGGLASVDNAQDYTEGIAKVYLRKSFGALPATARFPSPFAGSL